MKKLFLTGVFLLSILVSFSAIITVSSTADSGAGSLRDAIVAATAGDTIQFSLAAQDSIVVSTEIVINKDLVIIGPGSEALGISGGGNSRIFSIKKGNKVYISGLTLMNGNEWFGGAILNEGGDVKIEFTTIRNNVGHWGGGIANRTESTTSGNNSRMILNYCEVIDNVAAPTSIATTAQGGGIYNDGINGDSSILELNYCDISGNQVISGPQARGAVGGGIQNFVPDNGFLGRGTALCMLNNCSVTNNSVFSSTSNAFGGGVASSIEGPIQGGTARLQMRNCTVSGNSVESTLSSGLGFGGGIFSYVLNSGNEISTIDISHCTVTNNKSFAQTSRGAGLFTESSLGTGFPELDLNNNIIAGNNTGAQSNIETDVAGELFLNGYNLIGIGDFVLGPATGDMLGTLANPLDPNLSPLAFNGGFTKTHALKAGSAAINNGSPNSTLLTDQRDSARIGRADIGAYEFNPNVTNLFTLSGEITQSNGAPLQNTNVLLISFNTSDSSITAIDSAQTDIAGNYSFSGLTNQDIYLKALPDSTVYPTEIPTYYDRSLVFQDAISINPASTSTANFSTVAGTNPGGPGFIGGKITQGANKKTGESLIGIRVLLVDSVSMKVTAYADTDNNGNFVFPNLALGTYEVWVDQPFIDNGLAPTFTLTSQDASLSKLKFELQSTKLEWVGVVEGIDPANLWEENSYSLYPNPANKTVSFTWEANTFGENVEIKLYEATGKLVKQVYVKESGQLQIPLHNLSAGLYLYSVSHREEIKAIGKLMVR